MTVTETELAEAFRAWERDQRVDLAPLLAVRPRRSRSAWAAAGVLATAVAVAVVVGLVVTGAHPTAVPRPAASAPDALPAPTAPDDRATLEQAAWLRLRSNNGGASPADGDSSVYLAHHGQSFGVTGDGQIAAAGAAILDHVSTWDDVLALPTDPARLAPLVREQLGGQDAAQQVWAGAEHVLLDEPAPQDLRYALVRVMATLPGTTVAREGTVTVLTHPLTADRMVERLSLDPAGWLPRELTTSAANGAVVTRSTFLTRDYAAPPATLLQHARDVIDGTSP